MNSKTNQDPKRKFLFDPFTDMPFGPEVERKRMQFH